MYTISVEKSFDAAHFLQGYKGKCENLHGHSYKVVVRITAQTLDETGLAYDFTELKKQLMEVLAKYDHNCLNGVPPFDKINPSAENIARVIYEQLEPLFKEGTALDSVEVWESPQSCAAYRPG